MSGRLDVRRGRRLCGSGAGRSGLGRLPSKAPAREWLVMSMLQSAALAVPSAAMPTGSRESWTVGAAVLVVGPAGQTFLNAAFRNL